MKSMALASRGTTRIGQLPYNGRIGIMNDRKILLTSLKIVGIVIAALTGVYLLVELRNILVCVIFSLTLAAAIAPVAEWGEQRKISRITMVLLVYLFVALVYAV